MPLIDVSGPSGEPVTSAEIKASARIDGAEFDSQIAIIIPALRHQAERPDAEVARVAVLEVEGDGRAVGVLEAVLHVPDLLGDG